MVSTFFFLFFLLLLLFFFFGSWVCNILYKFCVQILCTNLYTNFCYICVCLPECEIHETNFYYAIIEIGNDGDILGPAKPERVTLHIESS